MLGSISQPLAQTRCLTLFALAAVTFNVSVPRARAQDTSRQRMADAVRAGQQQVQDRIEKLKLGIVRVEAQHDVKDLGTGIVLSATPQRILILTALHVVKDAQSISVYFYSDQSHAFTAHSMSKHSSGLDLAVLEIQASASVKLPADIPPYNFAANNTFVPTQHILSVDGTWTIVGNNVTKLNHDGDPQQFEYSNVSVGKGFSGGPVFDDYGDVIGMHDALSGEGNYAIAVKIDSALQVLEALNYSVPKAGPIVIPDYSAQSRTASTTPAETSANGTPQFRVGGASAAPTLPKGIAPFKYDPNHSASLPAAAAPVAAPAPDPCAAGCEVALSTLKHLHDFTAANHFNQPCRESVYAMPPTWPNGKSFLHITWCLSGPGALSQFQVRFAETDRQGDNDVQLGIAYMTGSSGQGHFISKDNTFWKISLHNPNFGGAFNLNAVTIGVEPLTPRR